MRDLIIKPIIFRKFRKFSLVILLATLLCLTYNNGRGEQSNDHWQNKYLNLESIDNNEIVDQKKPFSENKVWTGTYSCNGAKTPFNLITEKTNSKEIFAIFHFKISPTFQSIPERPLETSGVFTLKGLYDENNHSLKLKQFQMINMPGFTMIDLEGIINQTGKNISGKTTCNGIFDLAYVSSIKKHPKLEALLYFASYMKNNNINPSDYYSAVDYANRAIQQWNEKIKTDQELETLLKEYPIEPNIITRIKNTIEKKEYKLKISDVDETTNNYLKEIAKNRETRASKRTITIFEIDITQKMHRKVVKQKLIDAGGKIINGNEKQDFYDISAVSPIFQGCIVEACYYSDYLADLRLTFPDLDSNRETRKNANQLLELLITKYGDTTSKTYHTHNNQLIQLKRKIFFSNNKNDQSDEMIKKFIKEKPLADELGTTDFTKIVWEDKEKQSSVSYGKIGPKNAMGEAFGIQTEIWIEYSNKAISEELSKQQESFINELVEKSKGATKSNIDKAKSVL